MRSSAGLSKGGAHRYCKELPYLRRIREEGRQEGRREGEAEILRVCPTFYTWRLEQGYTAYNARREVKFAPAPSWGNVYLSKTKSIG